MWLSPPHAATFFLSLWIFVSHLNVVLVDLCLSALNFLFIPPLPLIICMPFLVYTWCIFLSSLLSISYASSFSLQLLHLQLPLFTFDQAILHSASVFFVNSPYTSLFRPQLCSVSLSVCLSCIFNAFETDKSSPVELGLKIKQLNCVSVRTEGVNRRRKGERNKGKVMRWHM